MEALLQEGVGHRPSLIHKPVKHMTRQYGPDVFAALPSVLGQIGAELRVSHPQGAEVCLIGAVVLTQTHPLQSVGIQPIHIRMGIPRIPTAPVDFATINGPQIGHDIQICLGNVRPHIAINKAGHKLGLHY
jgi:hypothetical protein